MTITAANFGTRIVEDEKEGPMQKDERDLLDVLKFELQVLERGGYGSSPREPWRQHLAFEDSPSCMNYDARENPASCEDCVLMQLVPPNQRGAKIPCRHIPLTKEGETLQCLYKCGTQQEIEDAMRNWLRSTIQQIEWQRGHGTAFETGESPGTENPH
jgi:hypothetical protein